MNEEYKKSYYVGDITSGSGKGADIEPSENPVRGAVPLRNLKIEGKDWEVPPKGYSIEETDQKFQKTLISGTNIKTINNEPILGEGNISISVDRIKNWGVEEDSIKPESVSASKTTFLKAVNNLFDKNTIVDDTIDVYGELKQSADYCVSDFIPCKRDTDYTYIGRVRNVNYYDKDKKYISREEFPNKQSITFRSTIEGYIRLNIYKNQLTNFAMYEGKEDLNNLNNNLLLDKKVLLADKSVDSSKLKFITTNVIEKEIPVANYNYTDNTILLSNGTEQPNNTFRVSEFIEINPALDRFFSSYSNSINNYPVICYYDASKNFIKGEEPVLQPEEKYKYKDILGALYHIPANAKYAKVSLNKGREKFLTMYHLDGENDLDIEGLRKYNYPFKNKKIINFGDSIFGNFTDTGKYNSKSMTSFMKEKLGADCYNAGFGGCRMGLHSKYWDDFSMHSLADSVNSGDWSKQKESAAHIPDKTFLPKIEMLEKMDWNTVDIITIGFGTNDYSGNGFINSDEAVMTDVWYYYKGATEYVIEKILSKYPHIKIVFVGSMWRWWRTDLNEFKYDSDDVQSKNTRGHMLRDYNVALKEICDKYHLLYVDTYDDLGINKFNYLTYFNPTDGTHPNENGRKLRADRISDKIISNL